MAWTQLKNAINSAIKANNNQEITGSVLNNVLNTIVNSIGKYATFAGIATPGTNPGVFEGPIVYFANTAGAYPNFGNITVNANQIVALYNIDGSWESYEIANNTITTDRLAPLAVTTSKIANGAVTGDKIAQGTITEDNIEDKSLSQNVLADNAVNTDIIQNGAVTTEKLADGVKQSIIYDVSAHNNGAVFESLQALLSSPNLGTLIPTSVRHGGMTIRFIKGSEQSSDNKYVQYRLMSDTFNTAVANWQGVDDEPTAGSDNLVKSGGVANKLAELEGMTIKLTDEYVRVGVYKHEGGEGEPYEQSFSVLNAHRIKIENNGSRTVYISIGELTNRDVSANSSFEYVNSDNNTELKINSYFSQDVDVYVSGKTDMLNSTQTKMDGSVNALNYLPSVEVKSGKFLNEYGVELTYNSAKYTDYILYSDLVRYTYVGSPSWNMVSVLVYDSNKILIDSYKLHTTEEITIDDIREVVNTKYACYLRFSSNNFLEVKAEYRNKVLKDSLHTIESLVFPERSLAKAYIKTDGSISSITNNYIVDVYAANGVTRKFRIKGKSNPWNTSAIYGKSSNPEIGTILTGLYATTSANNKIDLSVVIDGDECLCVNNGYGNELCVSEETEIVNPTVLSGKSAIYYGDSITAGSGGGNSPYGWATPISVNEKMGCLNRGEGGTTIRTTASRTSIYEKFLNDFSVIGKDMFDYWIFSGGYNESTETTYNGEISDSYEPVSLETNYTLPALEKMCIDISSKLAGKKYGFILPYRITDGWDSLADKMITVLEKWSIPYLDLRKCAGFTLRNVSLRKIYGTYIGSVAEYEPSKGYALDEQCKHDGSVWKTNQNIPAPAGAWNPLLWTKTSSGDNDYDTWHCNRFAYDHLASIIAEWMKGL